MSLRKQPGVSHDRGGVQRRASSRQASPSTATARHVYNEARKHSRRTRVPLTRIFPAAAQRRRVIDDDDDDEIEGEEDVEIEDYEDDTFADRREPGEEYDEEHDEEYDDDDLDNDDRRHSRRAADRATGEGDERDAEQVNAAEDEEEELVDGLGADPSLKRLLTATLQSTLRQEKAQEKNHRMMERYFLGNSSGSGRRAAPSPAADSSAGGAPRRGRPPAARRNRPDTLPLDGTSRGLFGPGYRAQVVAAVAPAWFKRVGAQFLQLPYNMSKPLAMRAGNLDPDDPHDSAAFNLHYKGETSRTASKVKNDLSNIFVGQLLTLKQLPPILDAASPNPPNLGVHRAQFKKLHDPPAGLDANDPHHRYCASWLATMKQPSNELVVFEEPTIRKLFEVDFFSRCQAKGFLPRSAHRWNLGTLAYFILFTQQRLTIKTSVGGHGVYGNLKDGADAVEEIERICAWLMDPIACPTTWQVLLTIRQQNPMYGSGTPAAVA